MEEFINFLKKTKDDLYKPTYLLHIKKIDKEKVIKLQAPCMFYEVSEELYYTCSALNSKFLSCLIWDKLGHTDFILSEVQCDQFFTSEKNKSDLINVVNDLKFH
jgi:hypothetical protein